jgi:hypothetical protein
MDLRAKGFLGRVIVLTSSLLFASGCSGDDGGSGDDANGGTNTGGTTGATGGSASGSGGSAQGGSGGSTQGGSSGSAQGGSSGSAQGGSSGSGGTSPLFTSAPNCDSNVERLEGTFQGTTVAVNRPTGSSTLDGRFYHTVSAGRSRIRLQWGNALLRTSFSRSLKVDTF